MPPHPRQEQEGTHELVGSQHGRHEQELQWLQEDLPPGLGLWYWLLLLAKFAI